MKYHKKKIYRNTHIFIPIFGVNGNIFFDREQYQKFCVKYHKHEHHYDINSVSGDCLINDSKREFAIGVFDDSLGTLSHELVHATQWILESCHMNSTADGGETMAYLTKYLFDEIEQRMKERVNNG